MTAQLGLEALCTSSSHSTRQQQDSSTSSMRPLLTDQPRPRSIHPPRVVIRHYVDSQQAAQVPVGGHQDDACGVRARARLPPLITRTHTPPLPPPPQSHHYAPTATAPTHIRTSKPLLPPSRSTSQFPNPARLHSPPRTCTRAASAPGPPRSHGSRARCSAPPGPWRP